ncbi:MAG: ADP-forming succinate--CoA ligase subunit beta [Anaerolineae bacterium]
MELQEYQSKFCLMEYGIPIPEGTVAQTPEEVYAIANRLERPVIIKAQVLAAGRDQSGGIKVAETPDQARELAEGILSLSINGLKVRKVLVEVVVAFEHEIYLAIDTDRALGKPVLLITSKSDLSVKRAVRSNPDIVLREPINPFLGIRAHQITGAISGINLPAQHWQKFTAITQALYKCYAERDATSAEIIPLVITTDEHLVALDAKVYIDDNALYRQEQFSTLQRYDDETSDQATARAAGIDFVMLNGEVACIGNGAGLTMALMDMVAAAGKDQAVRPGAFIDVCDRLDVNTLSEAFLLGLGKPEIGVIAINIFSGVMNCEDVADNLLEAYRRTMPDIPVIIRLDGLGAAVGRQQLVDASGVNLFVAKTTAEIAQRAADFLSEKHYGYSG